MSGFTKLVPEIIQSSIWNESPEIRCVWITMLAIKDENGYVRGDSQVISRLSNIPLDAVKAALDKFQQPDPHSHTPENEGRRISPVPGGWMVLNHWLYRGKDMKEIHAEYMRKWREKGNVKKCESHVITCESPSASASVLNPSPKKAGLTIPKAINTPPFLEAWSRWGKYRREIHKPLTPSSIKLQFRELETWGVDKAIRAIDKSIKNQWQGIFEPDQDNPASKVKATPHKPKPQELFEAARLVCVEQFKMLIKSKGTPDDVERLSVKLKDQYRGILVLNDNGEKRFLIQESKEIAKRQMGVKNEM